MKTKEVMKTKVPSDEEKPMELATCMAGIIDELEDGKKYPAARIYRSTLNSFAAFADEERMLTPSKGCILLLNVFTPGRLKTYQEWLRQRKSKWNTVSTYMRTLRAVYNRIYVPGSAEHNPKLFDDVYTKVESKTKRTLEEEEMAALIEVGLRLPHKTARKMVVDASVLSRESQCNLGYFVLMFFFHGMPFIDIAYLRKQDLQGDVITY